MCLVDWEHQLPANTEIVYSSLTIPDVRDDLDRDVAAFALENGYIIDVEWSPDNNEYLVTVLRGSYDEERMEAEERAATINDVIDLVRFWALSYSTQPIILMSQADTSYV